MKHPLINPLGNYDIGMARPFLLNGESWVSVKDREGNYRRWSSDTPARMLLEEWIRLDTIALRAFCEEEL